MAGVKSFFKKIVGFFAVLFTGMAAVYGVIFLLAVNTFDSSFALRDEDFKDNKADFTLVAEYVYGLYENEKAERDDLRRVLISLWKSEPEVTYIYEDGSERNETLAEEKVKTAVYKVGGTFPSPGGEFSVHISVRDGEVEFRGYRYSLFYSADGGRPDTGTRECKLERVSFLSFRWYHCYEKYAI